MYLIDYMLLVVPPACAFFSLALLVSKIAGEERLNWRGVVIGVACLLTVGMASLAVAVTCIQRM
jgi:hypothetical protein